MAELAKHSKRELTRVDKPPITVYRKEVIGSADNMAGAFMEVTAFLTRGEPGDIFTSFEFTASGHVFTVNVQPDQL